jgi:hypothetical protein
MIMTKSDLRTGMIVVLANGNEYMVYNGVQTSNNAGSVLVRINGSHSWFDLTSYNEDMTMGNREYAEWDIVKVIQVAHPFALVDTTYGITSRKVLWTRKKKYTYAQLREILGEEFEVVG